MKKFLLSPKSGSPRSVVVWNVASNGLNSIVSIILLLFVTRLMGAAEAGIFSLGFSTAQMMLTVGNYGMRNYQATDLDPKYSMGTYLSSRICTSVLMLILSALLILFRGYSSEKALILFSLCLLKVTDAFDDLYGGYYQKKGHLELSGKILFLRVSLYSAAFCLSLLLLHSTLLAIAAALLVSGALLVCMVSAVRSKFPLSAPDFSFGPLRSLLMECFPLCVGSFLLIYLGNAPKYAIDSYLSDTQQAYYNYLFMPCFVINLFVSFALQPLLVRLSVLWRTQNFSEFSRICRLIHLCAAGIALIIILGGVLLGCPLLSLFFGIDLNAYTWVLAVLLLGGTFFAFSVVEQVILTLMRRQYIMLWGFGAASLTALLISSPLVRLYGLMGAAWAYTISSGLLFLIFLATMLFHYMRDTGRLKK